jgi:hypothetical protein
MPGPKFRRNIGGQTVVQKRAPLVTDSSDNTQYRDWAHATLTTVTECSVQPFVLSNRYSIEENSAREFSDTVYRVWAPPSPAWQHTDRVLIDGVEHEVWAHPVTHYYYDGTPCMQTFLAKLRID